MASEASDYHDINTLLNRARWAYVLLLNNYLFHQSNGISLLLAVESRRVTLDLLGPILWPLSMDMFYASGTPCIPHTVS